MATGPIDLDARDALLLCCDPDVALTAPIRTRGTIRPLGPLPAFAAEVEGAAAGRGGPPARASDAVVHTLQGLRLRDVVAALRLGARRFHVVDTPDSHYEANARGAVALALGRSLARGIARTPLGPVLDHLLGRRLDPPWPSVLASRALPATVAPRSGAGRARRARRAVHLLLGPDPAREGAVPSLCALLDAAARDGRAPEVWTVAGCGVDARARASVERAGAVWRELAEQPRTGVAPAPPGVGRDLYARLERHVLARRLVPLVRALGDEPPGVVHAWHARGGALGGLAALAAGVPGIVVHAASGRPRGLSALEEEWVPATYAALARAGGVALVAPSRDAAADLAAWVGQPRERVHVGAPACAAVGREPWPAERRQHERRLLGVPDDAFLVVVACPLDDVAGVERLVAVVTRLRALVPGARALHVGEGPLAIEARLRAREAGLGGGALLLLGTPPDRDDYLALADAVLAPDPGGAGFSEVAAAAQAVATPVVLARGPGAAEVVDEGATGWLCDPLDVDGQVARLARLAQEDGLGRAVAARARAAALERFAPARFVAAVRRIEDAVARA